MMVLNDLGAMAARASGDLNTTNEMQAFSMGAGVAGYRLDRIHHFSVKLTLFDF